MIVHYSRDAKEAVGQYYESYMTDRNHGYQRTDLRQRADNYSKVSQTLFHIEHYLDKTFIDRNMKFIRIDNIAAVEYKITKNKSLLVKNIYFNNKKFNQYEMTVKNDEKPLTEQKEVKDSLDFMWRVLGVKI